MSYLVEQLPYCDLLRLSPLTGWFVLSVRQVVRLRVVEKKAELFRFSDRALLFLFAKFFSSQSQTEGQTSAPFWLGRAERNLSKFFLFQSWIEGSTSFSLSASVEFSSKEKVPSQSAISSWANVLWLFLFAKIFWCQKNYHRPKEKVPSQSALVHELMYSGFFICQNFLVSEKLPQACGGLVVCQKNLCCQQHPVFPGGHPSKYWLGSTLLNFSDRTRTGVFSVIWPLATLIPKVEGLTIKIKRF